MWTVENSLPADFVQRLSCLSQKEAPPAAYLAAFMDFIKSLKSTGRTGWINCNVPNPEHIGDHMYRMAILAMFTQNKDLDYRKCMQIALVHDMAECLVGDITPVDKSVSADEKHKRELETMVYIRDLVAKFNSEAASQIFESWQEYENQTTPEAALVKDIDKLELFYQTKEYKLEHPNLDLSGFDGVAGMVKTKEGKEWLHGAEYYYS